MLNIYPLDTESLTFPDTVPVFRYSRPLIWSRICDSKNLKMRGIKPLKNILYGISTRIKV